MHVARPVLGLIATITLAITSCGDDGGDDNGGGGDSCESFTACGGDLVGTWTFTDGCATLPMSFTPDIEPNNPVAECISELVPTIDVDITGTTSFRADGTYSVDQTALVNSGFSVSKACLERVANADVDCSAFDAETVGGRCVIREMVRSRNESTGTYTTSNNRLAMVEAGTDTTDEAVEYCVRGNTLTARLVMTDGVHLQWVARRQ